MIYKMHSHPHALPLEKTQNSFGFSLGLHYLCAQIKNIAT